METMEDYMRRLDKHSHQEQTLAPSEQKSVAAPAFKTEVLERGGNRKWSMGATRKSMYALKAVLRMFSYEGPAIWKPCSALWTCIA